MNIPLPSDHLQVLMYKMTTLGKNIQPGPPVPVYDPDAEAYFARVLAGSGTVISDPDKEIINSEILSLKSQGFWDDIYEIWYLESSRNAGTGTVAYGIKGINAQLVNGPTWNISGVNINSPGANIEWVGVNPDSWSGQTLMAEFRIDSIQAASQFVALNVMSSSTNSNPIAGYGELRVYCDGSFNSPIIGMTNLTGGLRTRSQNFGPNHIVGQGMVKMSGSFRFSDFNSSLLLNGTQIGSPSGSGTFPLTGTPTSGYILSNQSGTWDATQKIALVYKKELTPAEQISLWSIIST